MFFGGLEGGESFAMCRTDPIEHFRCRDTLHLNLGVVKFFWSFLRVKWGSEIFLCLRLKIFVLLTFLEGLLSL